MHSTRRGKGGSCGSIKASFTGKQEEHRYRTYTQLSQEQRYQIHALLKIRHRAIEIAHVLGVHPSIISLEVRRNLGWRGYRPHQDHRVTLPRRKIKFCRWITAKTWQVVEQLLREQWSPEQISG